MAGTKWPKFSRHFQMHSLEWKCMNFNKIFHWRSVFLRVNLQNPSTGSDNGRATSHCPNQCCLQTDICVTPSHWVNSYPRCARFRCFGPSVFLGNKLRWNFNQNTKLFIHEKNTSENIVCEVVVILSRGRRVKELFPDGRVLQNVKNVSLI